MSQVENSYGPRTQRIFRDLAERIIPSGGPDYPGAGDLGLTDFMLSSLGNIPVAKRGLAVVWWGWEISPIFSRKLRPFTRLSPEEQTEFLEGCEKSRISVRRWSLVLLKAIFMAFFYSDPRVWEKIGYTEECLYKPGSEAVQGK